MDISQQVEYFKNLSYETKKEKVLDMLKQLQWTHETFAMFYEKLSTLDKISDDILMYVYQSILEIANEIEGGRKNEAQDKIKKMGEILMKIKK